MRSRLSILAVLASWLLATGVQWDMVQVVGWGRMLAAYSSSMNLTRAIEKTFSGEMCSVCETVQTAKQQQDSNGLPLLIKAKLVLFRETPAPLVWSLTPEHRVRFLDDLPPLAMREEPSTPPPRA